MQFRRTLGFLLAGALSISAAAQADRSQPPAGNSTTATQSPEDSGAGKDSAVVQPQDTLNAYEQQMALVTVQTCAQLAQIPQAVRAGQMSSEQGEYLTRRYYELGLIRLQLLDNLHQILETQASKDSTPSTPEEENPQVQTSEQTLVVAPPTSSADIPDSTARYLQLTPVQIAAIQAHVSEEQRQIQPLLQRLEQNRKALTTATEIEQSGSDRIRQLAVEQSRILERLIIANSRLQRDIYQILTAAQRKKLDDMGQDTADVTERLFAQR